MWIIFCDNVDYDNVDYATMWIIRSTIRPPPVRNSLRKPPIWVATQ